MASRRRTFFPARTAWKPRPTAGVSCYEGDDCRLVYTYTPATGTLDDFRVQIDDSRPFQPAARGGATVIVDVRWQEHGSRAPAAERPYT